MSPATLEMEVRPDSKAWKRVGPKIIDVVASQTTRLPSGIESIASNDEETVVTFFSFERNGNHDNMSITGEFTIVREKRQARRGRSLRDQYVKIVTLKGPGSSLSYELPGTVGSANKPNKITIRHFSDHK